MNLTIQRVAIRGATVWWLFATLMASAQSHSSLWTGPAIYFSRRSLARSRVEAKPKVWCWAPINKYSNPSSYPTTWYKDQHQTRQKDIVNDTQGINETLPAKKSTDKDDIINVADMTHGSVPTAFAKIPCSCAYLIRRFPTFFQRRSWPPRVRHAAHFDISPPIGKPSMSKTVWQTDTRHTDIAAQKARSKSSTNQVRLLWWCRKRGAPNQPILLRLDSTVTETCFVECVNKCNNSCASAIASARLTFSKNWPASATIPDTEDWNTPQRWQQLFWFGKSIAILLRSFVDASCKLQASQVSTQCFKIVSHARCIDFHIFHVDLAGHML